jgi:hypothetical protein
MSDTITLEFLAGQQHQLLDEMSLFGAKLSIVQDDIRVLLAMAVRQDTTTKAVFDQVERRNEAIRRVSDETRRAGEEMRRLNDEMQRIHERSTSIEARIP